MLEEWKDIIGYEGLYQISNFGRVFSLRQDRILKDRGDRYFRVALNNGGVVKNFSVHRLVGRHFVDGYSEKLVINHKDCNRYNNRCDNLEWVTNKENMHHAIRNNRMNRQKMAETKRKFFKTNDGKELIKKHINKICKISTEEVKKMRNDFKKGCSLNELSAKYNCTKSNACLIVNNKTRIYA